MKYVKRKRLLDVTAYISLGELVRVIKRDRYNVSYVSVILCHLTFDRFWLESMTNEGYLELLIWR